MSAMSTLLGGAIGVGCQLFANKIQKVPLSRYPWMHVFMFFAGCWAGDYYPKLEKSVLDDVNRMRAQRGMPKLVGTNAWIRYKEEEK